MLFLILRFFFSTLVWMAYIIFCMLDIFSGKLETFLNPRWKFTKWCRTRINCSFKLSYSCFVVIPHINYHLQMKMSIAMKIFSGKYSTDTMSKYLLYFFIMFTCKLSSIQPHMTLKLQSLQIGVIIRKYKCCQSSIAKSSSSVKFRYVTVLQCLLEPI